MKIFQAERRWFPRFFCLRKLFGWYKPEDLLGWQKEPQDTRDRGPNHPLISPILNALKKNAPKILPKKADEITPLVNWVYDQGPTGSCTGQAGVSDLRYIIKLVYGVDFEPSRLFVYKTTRNLMYGNDGKHPDHGAYNRLTMKALATYGAPSEKIWPFSVGSWPLSTNLLNEEPRSFHYGQAQNYQALRYFRVDELGMARPDALQSLKQQLVLKLPVTIGFRVFPSIKYARKTGDVPFPSMDERFRGGHAVMTVGYDDERVITHPDTGEKTVGAIKFLNSWGNDWGQKGYGWLPYEYFLEELSWDYWCLVHAEMLDMTPFEEPKKPNA